MSSAFRQSLDCCYRQPHNRVTFKSYPPVSEDDPANMPIRFGLLRCTPERPEGCCSCDESAYDTRTEADAAAAELNERARDCRGHAPGPFDPMGETVYCDGSCSRMSR